MSAFLVNGNLLTDKSAIRDMWDNHFEALGTSSENSNFDDVFFFRVTRSVNETLVSYSNYLSDILCKPLEYKEVSYACSNLKSGVRIDYEHIHHAGPPLWKLILIFPLFKWEVAKANNKDNCSSKDKHITFFSNLLVK